MPSTWAPGTAIGTSGGSRRASRNGPSAATVVVVADAVSGRFLGRTGLKHWPGFGETELGWVLRPEARGRGYATEAGQALLDWGFEGFDFPYVTAMIRPGNVASVGVAERLGMAPLREDELQGDAVVVYSIGRGAWEGRSE